MTTSTPDDEHLKAQVSKELEDAKSLAKTLKLEEVKSGEWFFKLLKQVVMTYNRNARAIYFQKKYPGLPPDDIADILTSVTVRYATIAGAIAGAAATANQIAALSSAGMTAALFIGSIGAEMLYLSQIQMRLVLDLSVVYDLQLDLEDPEDVFMIFGYALGVTPTEMIGKGFQIAAGAGAKEAVKKYVSKGTLQAIQDFARRLGFKILQRTILKYAVPVASAAVGSSYNYVTTKSVGRIAKAHLKNRGKVTDELRVLVSRQHIYDLAFPAAVMYVAQVDGQFSTKEKELYRAMLSRMSFDEHTQVEFQKLTAEEENILEAIGNIEDEEVRLSLMETLVLMTIYDGELAEKELEFLRSAAERLNVPLDIAEIEQRTKDYQIIVQKNLFEKTAEITGSAAAKAINVAGQAVSGVKNTALVASEKVSDVFGKVLAHKKEDMKVTALSENPPLPAQNVAKKFLLGITFARLADNQQLLKKVVCIVENKFQLILLFVRTVEQHSLDQINCTVSGSCPRKTRLTKALTRGMGFCGINKPIPGLEFFGLITKPTIALLPVEQTVNSTLSHPPSGLSRIYRDPKHSDEGVVCSAL